jgi:hypothetical protein
MINNLLVTYSIMDKYEYKYRKYKAKYLNAKYDLEHNKQFGGLGNDSDNSDNVVIVVDSDKLDDDNSEESDKLDDDNSDKLDDTSEESDKLDDANSDKLDDNSDKLDDTSEESDQFTEDKYDEELRKISDKFFERPKIVVKPTSHKKWKKFIDTFKKKYKVTKDAIEFTHGNVRARVIKSKYFDVIIKYNNITIKINIEDAKKRKNKFSIIKKFVKKLGYDISKKKTVQHDVLVFVFK